MSPVINGEKFSIPTPTLCPDCRQQRRLSFRNERTLYHRKCSKTNFSIISQYPKDVPFPVYKNSIWYSDDFDPLHYAKEIDWDRPLIDQFQELQSTVPRFCVIQEGEIENSEYCQAVSNSKNCYLMFSSNQNEDCMYSIWINDCKNVVDNYSAIQSTLCYECTDITSGYNLVYANNSFNCTDCILIENCRNCKNCLYCTNLSSQEYCLWNKKVSREEFEKEKTKFLAMSYKEQQLFRKQFYNWSLKYPRNYTTERLTENSTGNYLDEAKNANYCFECKKIEDCSYSHSLVDAKDCMDISYWGRNIELCYYTQATGFNSMKVLFSNLAWSDCSNLIYCDHCFSSRNSILSIGLKKNEYCILNKKYSKKEYQELLPKIILKLKKENIWGEFFPQECSTYRYNETVAKDYFPLSKEEAIAKGYRWHDEDTSSKYQGIKYQIPENIENVKDDITSAILECEVTGQPYKIIPQELKFYKEMKLPIPRKCPDQRHKERIAIRNPRKLWNRKCMKCEKDIKTSYSPERPEIVYCKKCYLNEIY